MSVIKTAIQWHLKGEFRTASITRTLSVRTHDVGITTFSVPQTAQPDQSKTPTVGVANGRYPERVTVQLLKSVAGSGFQPVGQLTQSVPARGRNRTTVLLEWF